MPISSQFPPTVHPKVANLYNQPYWSGYMTAGGLQGISPNVKITPNNSDVTIDMCNVGGKNSPSSMAYGFGAKD